MTEVLRPTDLDEARDLMRSAAADQKLLRPCGRRSRRSLTLPGVEQAWLSFAAIDRIHWIDPADFTCEIDAGLSPAALDQALAEHGLMFGVLAPGAESGTLGGLLQSRSPSLLSGSVGLPRDQVLGARWLTGDGEEFPTGSRVVKSVAGYDLTRLLLGSQGMLAANTRLILRLRPRPRALRWFRLTPTWQSQVTDAPAWLDFTMIDGEQGMVRIGAWDDCAAPDPDAVEIDSIAGQKTLTQALQLATEARYWRATVGPVPFSSTETNAVEPLLVDHLAHQSAWASPPPRIEGAVLLPAAIDSAWLEPLQAALRAPRNIQQAVTTASATSPTKAPTQR